MVHCVVVVGDHERGFEWQVIAGPVGGIADAAKSDRHISCW